LWQWHNHTFCLLKDDLRKLFILHLNCLGGMIVAWHARSPAQGTDVLLHCRDLPGLIDLIFSGVWSVFFLAAGASIISWGACKASALCLVWKCTTAISFLLWVLYAISAVLASLDLRAQLMALREPAVASSAAAVKNGKSRCICLVHDTAPPDVNII